MKMESQTRRNLVIWSQEWVGSSWGNGFASRCVTLSKSQKLQCFWMVSMSLLLRRQWKWEALTRDTEVDIWGSPKESQFPCFTKFLFALICQSIPRTTPHFLLSFAKSGFGLYSQQQLFLRCQKLCGKLLLLVTWKYSKASWTLLQPRDLRPLWKSSHGDGNSVLSWVPFTSRIQ